VTAGSSASDAAHEAADAARDAADAAKEAGKAQLVRLGRLIREQRSAAEMSLRELAARTNVSNPYLSQIERGLHAPSVRVLRSIATALNVSAETLLVQAGLLDSVDPAEPPPTVVSAINADDRLTGDQKAALLAVYRSYIAADG
jgi:transcriptional regulator with XRE-family HTH domain